jgi:hypothetical protein
MPSNSAIMDINAVIDGFHKLVDVITATMEGVRIKAISRAPTQRIAGAIGVTKAEVRGEQIVAEVYADLKIAPEAAAFELGSGLSGLKHQKYIIAPKKADALVFKWQNEDMSAGHPHTKDGKVILPFVNHPGIAARPYLEPSFREELNDAWVESINWIIRNDIMAGGDVTIELKVVL